MLSLFIDIPEVVTMPTAVHEAAKNVIVAEDDRLDFFPSKFQNIMVAMGFEGVVFDMAKNLATNYTGGQWEFVDLGGDCFFMFFDEEQPMEVKFGADETYKTDSLFFSIMINLMAYSHLSNHDQYGHIFEPKYTALAQWFYDVNNQAMFSSTDEAERQKSNVVVMLMNNLFDR